MDIQVCFKLLALTFICLLYEDTCVYGKCYNLGQKEGCFELDALYERTLLVDWKRHIKWWKKKKDLKNFVEELACKCATLAKKKKAAGYALTSWGKCFAVTLNDLNVLNDDDKTTPCYKGDGSYSECDDKDPDTLCVGDDTSAYIYDLVSVDGSFGEWGKWSNCSTTCGSGFRSRHRKCDNPKPEMGGDDCTGDKVQKKTCNKNPCPVNGGWSEWAGWCSCSKSCNHGNRTRSRDCNSPKPMNDGLPCDGEAKEVGECAVQPCPIHGNYTAWSGWGECSLTCGGGKRRRQRACTNPAPKYGGEVCEGPKMEDKVCNEQKCKVSSSFGEWSTWSDCSELCGVGERYRKQLCVNDDICKDEERKEKEPCDNGPCPVDGMYGEWTQWTKCNRECGMGNSTRERFCNSPTPQHGGRKCQGDAHDRKPCIETMCPVDGDWNSWNPWSTCTTTCGNEGKRARVRTCDKPKPRNGGKECPGSDTEEEECKQKECPKEAGLTAWGGWIACSKTCGYGRQRRFRQCQLKVGKKCKGKLMEQKRCYTKCPDHLVNCAIANKAEFFPNGTTTKRGYVHLHTIKKIGKQYGVSFNFKLNSFKSGVILQVRANRNGQSRIGRRMPRVELTKFAKLKLQIPLGEEFKHEVLFPMKLTTNETYTLELTQIKEGESYIVSMTLSDSKHDKSITMENKAPTETYKVRVYAAPGWREVADAKISKLEIYGICKP